MVEDIENQTVATTSSASNSKLKVDGEITQTQNEQLAHQNKTTHFNLENQATNSDQALLTWNENFKDNDEFKAFSRTYILQHMLWALNSGKSAFVYLNHLNCLRDIEQYFSELTYDTTREDLMVALTNAWTLFQKRGITSDQNNYLEHIRTSTDKRGPKSTENRQNSDNLTRTRVIELLLTSISNENQYRTYLKELNEAEKEFEKNYIPECWS